MSWIELERALADKAFASYPCAARVGHPRASSPLKEAMLATSQRETQGDLMQEDNPWYTLVMAQRDRRSRIWL